MIESNTLIAALRQTSREDWELIWREPIESVVENANCAVTSYRHRRNGGFCLTRHEMFRSHSHTTASVVLDSTDCEAIVAGGGIAITVNVVDVTVIWIYGSVVHPTKKSVNCAELGSWLSAIGIGHYDPTGHPVQAPSSAAIGGAVKHVVDIFRTSNPRSDISLE